MNYYNQIKNKLTNNEIYKKKKDYSKNRNDLRTRIINNEYKRLPNENKNKFNKKIKIFKILSSIQSLSKINIIINKYPKKIKNS